MGLSDGMRLTPLSGCLDVRLLLSAVAAAAGGAAHERQEEPVAHEVHEGEHVGGARALVLLRGLLVTPLRVVS